MTARVRELPELWVEVAPPRGIVAGPLLEQLAALRGVAGLNLTDNAMGRVRMSALAFAALVRNRIGLPVMLNFTCRDRNLLALRSDLIGAAALGVEAVVALAGDRLPAGTGARGVYEVDAAGLLRAIGALNRGDPGQGCAPLRTPPGLLAGAACNPNRADWRRELELLERKAAAGARFLITQPVFDPEPALRILEGARRLALPVFLGIMPIKSAAMARYLRERIRELQAAAAHLERYESLSDVQVRRWSLARCRELMQTLAPHAAGFVIMSGGGPSLAIELALDCASSLPSGIPL